ncbi:hypothetical protein AMELA_G00040530 [Ameiurus melas]|uniref:Uncharacterized protein n=1 Tax=Ameiurus melas TaxID=219545 RepID=A0A7J6B9M9_AMEME|nr:hypothetical protein AMELA_G00040530 [Ameiurus melas]
MELHLQGSHHMGLDAVPALGNELEDNEDTDTEAGKKISVNISEAHLAHGSTQLNLSPLDDATTTSKDQPRFKTTDVSCSHEEQWRSLRKCLCQE